MQDTAFNLLFAGHDTSASTLMLLLRFFQQEPATLRRLRDEQQQVRWAVNLCLRGIGSVRDVNVNLSLDLNFCTVKSQHFELLSLSSSLTKPL